VKPLWSWRQTVEVISRLIDEMRARQGMSSQIASHLACWLYMRVDHVDEGLVGREEAMPSGQDIALVPAFQGVLGQHLQHPSVR
jgi:hypothetical protein